MTGVTFMCLAVVLLVKNFPYWLVGSKKTRSIVKPSFMYNINDSVMKSLVLYGE